MAYDDFCVCRVGDPCTHHVMTCVTCPDGKCQGHPPAPREHVWAVDAPDSEFFASVTRKSDQQKLDEELAGSQPVYVVRDAGKMHAFPSVGDSYAVFQSRGKADRVVKLLNSVHPNTKWEVVIRPLV